MKVSIETDKSKIVIDDGFVTTDEVEERTHRDELMAKAYKYIKARDLMMQVSKDGLVVPIGGDKIKEPSIALCGKEVAK